MRHLLFLTLLLASSIAFAKDGYDLELHELISANNVESRVLVEQLKKALSAGNTTVSFHELLNQPTRPMEVGTQDARRAQAIAAYLGDEPDYRVPTRALFEELQIRTNVQWFTSFVDGIENRYRAVPSRNTYLSGVIMEIIERFPHTELRIFSHDEAANWQLMGEALDFVAFTALANGTQNGFRTKVESFVLRGKANLSIRMFLLEWMLTDMSKNLAERQQINRPAAKWLHDLAISFGQLEYPDVAKEGHRKILDLHQKMIAQAQGRNISLCSRFFAPLAIEKTFDLNAGSNGRR